jgi:hypothetical protein
MATFAWTIPQVDRLIADGFVVTVHYVVTATDDSYSASVYGTLGYSPIQSKTYIPYDQLTEATVVSWVQNKLGKDVVETNLQSQIDSQKNPTQTVGVPWA